MIAFVLLFHYVAGHTHGGGGVCSTASDCNMNGICTAAGACECDGWWTGARCATLSLKPAKIDNGYQKGGNGEPITNRILMARAQKHCFDTQGYFAII